MSYPGRIAPIEMHTRLYADTLLYNQEAYERWQSLPGNHAAPQLYIDGHRHPGWYFQWEDSIVARMAFDAPVTITIEGIFNPGDGQGTVTATYRNDSTASILGRVMFVIVEDSIYFMDSLAGQMKEWHNHTARDYIPGPLGTMITVPPGDSVSYSQPFTIPPEWRFEYCSVITFIQDTLLYPDTVTQNIWQGAVIQVSSMIGIREDVPAAVVYDVRLPTIVRGPLTFTIERPYRIFDCFGREIHVSDPAPGIYFVAAKDGTLHKVVKVE